LTQQIVFWFLSAVAVASSAAAVTARNPVYTAIWFAASLLGVAGLFLFQNAQFLGVATIVVYAGAIVVTFLFVLMLANPEGDARYDRISWAKFPIPVMMLAAAILVGVTTFAFLKQPPQPRPTANQSLVSGEHMAHLGGELFSKHMISVEVVGTILLVALVGAVAIVIQAKERRSAREQLTESTIPRSVIQ
jgi:NADH-quinone oxidoreductase subunit J